MGKLLPFKPKEQPKPIEEVKTPLEEALAERVRRYAPDELREMFEEEVEDDN